MAASSVATGSISTVTSFMFEELTAESFDDRINRRQVHSLVTDYDTQVVSGLSGFKFTATLG